MQYLQEPVIYITGFVERNVIYKIKCDICVQLLNACEPNTSTFIELKSKFNLRVPRRDTVKICEVVHKVINIYKIENKIMCNNIDKIVLINSFKNLNINLLYQNFDNHILECEVLENHKYYLIRLIISIYTKVNLYHIGKQYTINQHKDYVREKLSKTIHFMGQ